jgi:acyl-CoA thioesterase-1
MPTMFLPSKPDRRAVLGGLAAMSAGAPALAQRVRTVALFGDSITAGYGLPTAAALPAQLELAMLRLGAPVRVRPLGVSGDTTDRGLARLISGQAPAADLWVVALGGNDLLMGVDPTVTRANLEAIVGRLLARRAAVVLAGIKAPGFFGRAYAAAFDSAFAEVARTRRLPFYPNLLAGVLGNRALNQPDGIHPNAEGVKRIASGLAPAIAPVLAALR